jgi:hypothetical protein
MISFLFELLRFCFSKVRNNIRNNTQHFRPYSIKVTFQSAPNIEWISLSLVRLMFVGWLIGNYNSMRPLIQRTISLKQLRVYIWDVTVVFINCFTYTTTFSGSSFSKSESLSLSLPPKLKPIMLGRWLQKLSRRFGRGVPEKKNHIQNAYEFIFVSITN